MISHSFVCERTETRSPDKRIATSGVAWSENNYRIEMMAVALFSVVCVVGLFIVVAGCVMTAVPAERFRAIALVVSGVCLVWLAFLLLSRPVKGMPRSVVFHRDGRVEYPQGMAWWPKQKWASAPHTEITSIEARQVQNSIEGSPTDWGVVIYRRNGDVIEISTGLLRDEAHKVAVQLTQALTAMREDLASLQTARKASVDPMAAFLAKFGSGKRAVID